MVVHPLCSASVFFRGTHPERVGPLDFQKVAGFVKRLSYFDVFHELHPSPLTLRPSAATTPRWRASSASALTK